MSYSSSAKVKKTLGIDIHSHKHTHGDCRSDRGSVCQSVCGSVGGRVRGNPQCLTRRPRIPCPDPYDLPRSHWGRWGRGTKATHDAPTQELEQTLAVALQAHGLHCPSSVACVGLLLMVQVSVQLALGQPCTGHSSLSAVRQ